MAKLYIDTNIIINMINNEKNPFGKNMGNPAAKLFCETISCKHHLILSSWMLKELNNKISPDKTTMFFLLAKQKIIQISYNDTDVHAAKLKSKNNYHDALHIILAEKAKADYIITRDTNHFREIGSSIQIKKPEDLL